jgi:opacity protein-like surface antigen
MKRIVLTAVVALMGITAWSQENAFTVSGGYAFANAEEYDGDVTGYRINGLYEFTPLQGRFVNGFSVGYIRTEASVDAAIIGSGDKTIKLNTFPVYYAPKYLIGSGKFQGFVKGALGMHFSNYKIEGGAADDAKTSDAGFYGGAGLGALYNINEKMFLNLEYEWAYLSNSLVPRWLYEHGTDRCWVQI